MTEAPVDPTEMPSDDYECVGEIGSMDERCGALNNQEDCEDEGKNPPFSDGVCDWVKKTDETETPDETDPPMTEEPSERGTEEENSVVVDFTVSGVTAENFEEVEGPFKTGLSRAFSIDESDIDLTLVPSNTRRLLTEGTIRAEIAADSPDDAESIASDISETSQSDILNSVNDALSSANVEGVGVSSMSEPVTASTAEEPSEPYGYGADGSANCEDPMMIIETAEQCEAAADYLGGNYRASGAWNIQYGCVAELAEGGKVWFNTRQDGSPASHRRPICWSDAPTESPMDTTEVAEVETTEVEPTQPETTEAEVDTTVEPTAPATTEAEVDTTDVEPTQPETTEAEVDTTDVEPTQPETTEAEVEATEPYGYGADGSANCEDPMMIIETAEQCEAAADYLGGNYRTSGAWNIQYGCVSELTEGGNVWFNSRQGRNPVSHRRPVCWGDVPTESPVETTLEPTEAETTLDSTEVETTLEPTEVETTEDPVEGDPIMYGDLESLDCSLPYVTISTEEDCRSAAAYLGATFATAGSYPIPTGCAGDDTDGGKIWFNTRNPGMARNHRRPICELPGAEVEPTTEEPSGEIIEEQLVKPYLL